MFEEADECVDWLTYLRDARIEHDPVLLQEAEELARIFAKSVKSAREKSRLMLQKYKSGRSGKVEK